MFPLYPVLSGSDGLVKLWTIKTNECVKTLDAHQDKVWGLHGSHKDDRMVTGSADSNITVWVVSMIWLMVTCCTEDAVFSRPFCLTPLAVGGEGGPSTENEKKVIFCHELGCDWSGVGGGAGQTGRSDTEVSNTLSVRYEGLIPEHPICLSVTQWINRDCVGLRWTQWVRPMGLIRIMDYQLPDKRLYDFNVLYVRVCWHAGRHMSSFWRQRVINRQHRRYGRRRLLQKSVSFLKILCRQHTEIVTSIQYHTPVSWCQYRLDTTAKPKTSGNAVINSYDWLWHSINTQQPHNPVLNRMK